MNWTTKGVAALVAGTALFCGMGSVTAVALTGHHGTAPTRTATPPAAVTLPAPKTPSRPRPRPRPSSSRSRSSFSSLRLLRLLPRLLLADSAKLNNGVWAGSQHE